MKRRSVAAVSRLKSMEPSLVNAVESVPAGPWAIGVSGGADSVALLTLLRARSNLSLHVVHLNHQTRGSESDGDAESTSTLATRLGLPHTIALRSKMEREVRNLPENPSARYRRLRIALFGRVVKESGLHGVLLAHHADDQAETILHRLLRGSGYSGIGGMLQSSVVSGVRCLRPLLGVRRDTLRQWLNDNNEAWREDSSNRSPDYLRNRLRMLLAGDPLLHGTLLELGIACAAVRDWVSSVTPPTNAVLDLKGIAGLPNIVARVAARNWLITSGVEAGKIEPATIDTLLAMFLDASTPSRQQFPCGVMVGRRKGMIERIGCKRSPVSDAHAG